MLCEEKHLIDYGLSCILREREEYSSKVIQYRLIVNLAVSLIYKYAHKLMLLRAKNRNLFANRICLLSCENLISNF